MTAEILGCSRCEGEGQVYADGKAHYCSEHFPTTDCPSCDGTGKVCSECGCSVDQDDDSCQHCGVEFTNETMDIAEIKKLMADYREKQDAAFKAANIEVNCPNCGDSVTICDLAQCQCGRVICSYCASVVRENGCLCLFCYDSLREEACNKPMLENNIAQCKKCHRFFAGKSDYEGEGICPACHKPA